jgi:hypothetical protein
VSEGVGVVCIILHVNVAGVGSGIPDVSIARTINV